MGSKKESLVILEEMMDSFKCHIVEIEEAELEIVNDEKKVSLKRRLHEELRRKIEVLEAELKELEVKTTPAEKDK